MAGRIVKGPGGGNLHQKPDGAFPGRRRLAAWQGGRLGSGL